VKTQAIGSIFNKAYFAGGCFWGIEFFLSQLPGVQSVQSGYMGGMMEDPSYYDVCSGNSGHVECVEVAYDSTRVSFESLAICFFEIHDPTQVNGQGPDIGDQYRSVVFVNSPQEEAIVQGLIGKLEAKGLDIATSIEPVYPFWLAEEGHQNYYERRGITPTCHARVKRFDD
jgi:peptide methionine sulfoxide reductase msrA/msrB